VYHTPGRFQESGFADVVSGLFLLDDGFYKACKIGIAAAAL